MRKREAHLGGEAAIPAQGTGAGGEEALAFLWVAADFVVTSHIVLDAGGQGAGEKVWRAVPARGGGEQAAGVGFVASLQVGAGGECGQFRAARQIGRASCRERV